MVVAHLKMLNIRNMDNFDIINITCGHHCFLQLLSTDLLESCSSEDLTIRSYPPTFYYQLGAIRLGSLVVTLPVR
jgi:hypothetical protein